METEAALLTAPYENLSKLFRNAHHLLEKETAQLVTSLNELSSKKATLSVADADAALEKMLTRLRNVKKKMEELQREEETYIAQCEARAGFLKQMTSSTATSGFANPGELWMHVKTERVLVDYFLREGFPQSAEALATEANIKDMVDLEVFTSARKVTDSLLGGKCVEALKWCNDNRSKLKKLNSNFEFKLRVQEYVELLRAGKKMEAVAYARKFFGAFASTNMPQIQQAMAALAFPPDTACQRYKHLFSLDRWKDLVSEFQHDNYSVYGLSPMPEIFLLLQQGLTALKTWQCYDRDNQQINCPVCQPALRLLAAELSFAHHASSALVCRISGEKMSDLNPPMILPNGYAYSRKALQDMAARNKGVITCPRTRQTYKIEEARVAFIL